MNIILHITRYILLLAVVSFSFLGKAQIVERFNSFSYNVNEGLLQSHVDDMAFDQNNFAWLSFSNGIQKFDGNTFTDIPVQEGLPDDKGTAFFTTSKGHLLISHSQGISKYDISNNKFSLIYRNDPSWNEPVSFLGEDNNTLYFFTGDASIAAMDINSFAIISNVKTGFRDYKKDPYLKLKYTDNIVNHCIGLYADSTLFIWNLAAKKISHSAKNTLLTTVFKFWLNTSHEILYFSKKKDNRLMKYDFKTGENKITAVYPDDHNKSPRVVFFNWKNKYHLSYFGQIYETDSLFSTKMKELKNFQNEPLARNFVTNAVREDRMGNLYLLTANNGIRKIVGNNYPIRYFGSENRDNNFIVSICPDKEANRVLAGTQGNGVLIFDTLQHLIKQIHTLPGQKQGFTPVCIVRLKEGGYLFFCWGQKKLWKLAGDLTGFSEVPVAYGNEELPEIYYFSNVLLENDSLCMVHTKGAVYKINQVTKTVIAAKMPVSDALSCMLYKNYLVAHSNNELVFIDTASMHISKRIALKNTGGVRCFTADKEGNLYAGSNKGVFKLHPEGNLLWQVNKETGLPDECIYAMALDQKNFLWCSTNKGIFRLDKDNSIFQLRKEDGLQENEFNTNVVAMSRDGEIFFGGVSGVSSFFPATINALDEKINLLFTNIKINNEDSFKDTAVWNIQKMELPYYQNSLSFDFLAMANSNPGQYIYQYKMDGVDGQWIKNNGLQTVHYFLPPGEYIFKIYASRFFDKDARSMKELRIIIHPPFWKSWWFFGGLAILLIFSLAYGINQYNRRKYRKKLAELESEHKMRLERERISRDLHDNIGAYANAVLYNSELLEKEAEEKVREGLLKDLKFASKDIITSLRETIWALKKDNYTAEDCLLRMHNFIQPFNRYYKHIQFRIEGEAPAGKILHYTRALNLVRIIQEAVTNAIKHAGPETICIVSSSKNGEWELIVRDDGKGFDNNSIQQTEQGNGLNNMKQRALNASFNLIIQSRPGLGTSIIIQL